MDTKKYNVLHITLGHSAFDCRIFYKELRSLSQKYNCYELCGVADGKTLTTMHDKLKIEQGIHDNICCLAYKSEKTSFILSFLKRHRPTLYKRLYNRYLTGQVLKVLNKNNIHPDIIHFHDLRFMYVAIALKEKLGCKLIFDSHEFYFAYSFNVGFTEKSCFNAGYILSDWSKAIKASDYVIGCTKTMDNLISIIRQDDNHGIVYNTAMFEADSRERSININNKIILLHEGSLEFSRGLKLMIDIFRDEYIREHFQLRIVGTINGEEKKYFEQKCQEYNITEDNIYFTGWVDYLDVPKEMKGDIGILFFEKKLNAFYSMPNKFYNYLAKGLPVIATHCADFCDMIEKKQTGVVVERNVESVKDGLIKLVDNYDYYQRNVLKSQDEYLWSNDEKTLFAIYEQVLKTK